VDASGGAPVSMSADVCILSRTSASIVTLLLLWAVWGGYLAVWFGLSDPHVAFVRNSRILGGSVNVVLTMARMRVFVCLSGGRSIGTLQRLVWSLVLSKERS
jgi:hypothetical protein